MRAGATISGLWLGGGRALVATAPLDLRVPGKLELRRYDLDTNAAGPDLGHPADGTRYGRGMKADGTALTETLPGGAGLFGSFFGGQADPPCATVEELDLDGALRALPIGGCVVAGTAGSLGDRAAALVRDARTSLQAEVRTFGAGGADGRVLLRGDESQLQQMITGQGKVGLLRPDCRGVAEALVLPDTDLRPAAALSCPKVIRAVRLSGDGLFVVVTVSRPVTDVTLEVPSAGSITSTGGTPSDEPERLQLPPEALDELRSPQGLVVYVTADGDRRRVVLRRR